MLCNRVMRTVYALAERWKMTNKYSEEDFDAEAVEFGDEEVHRNQSITCDSYLLLRFCLKTENNP